MYSSVLKNLSFNVNTLEVKLFLPSPIEYFINPIKDSLCLWTAITILIPSYPTGSYM